ncbi:hypothetical protein PBY51_001675 [Eleginops maclovinus]|uniref:CENP-T/Histone H4 histone fold domain-containing protein n=1 Tax=Eleginops maclovinus TaxID=56733 RepID=A0AAN7WWW7_ELEMC|nr:hypothetical protein PBY51_001675 [Eleginops maclovinus]
MDRTEDLSARVLLNHILSTEQPRTPITRSASKKLSFNRRSSRLRKNDAFPQTPMEILKSSQRHKLRKSINRQSLNAMSSRIHSGSFRLPNRLTSNSMLLDDGETPRHILMNILRTEPVRTPLFHESAMSEEPQTSQLNSNSTGMLSSLELSGLDLPDLTIGAASTVKGLSRKRRRRSLNVTAFEKRLKAGEDFEEEKEESVQSDRLSPASSSQTSLSLKTPFVDVPTEKKFLRRRVSKRRVISEEEFGAAVDRQQMGDGTGFGQTEQILSKTTDSEGITFGLSKLSESDIMTNILQCDTALYDQPDATTDNSSIVATQDKPTVMASQLQREVEEEEEEEEVEQMEAGGLAESLDSVRQDAATTEEEENNVEAQTEEEAEADSQNEETAAVSAPSEIEESAADTQTEEEQEGLDSQVEEDVIPDTQEEEEEEEEEESDVDIQPGGDDAAKTQSAEDEETADDQSDQEVPAEKVEDDLADSQPEDEHNEKPEEEDAEQQSEQEERDLEHTSRRACRSEGPVIVPLTEAAGDLDDATEEGWSDGKSKAPSSVGMGSPETHASYTDPDPGADKENSFPLPEPVHDTEDLSDDSPEEPAAEAPKSDAIPNKTPAFVRQKLNFFQPNPQASSTVFKNIQASSTGDSLPAPKPKPGRKKGKGPAKKQTELSKSYLMNVFKHFAKTRVSPDVYPVLKDIMDKYFDRLAEDLETYAVHAKRKTIEVEDAELLLRRQGHVNDMVPVEVLIEKYLRMEQRKLLIPIATSGNIVIPKKRR